MSDEKYYEAATAEIAANKINKALLIKATVLADGDENKAKVEYIKLRVEQLKYQHKKEKTINAIAATAAIGVAVASITPFRKITIFLLYAYAIFIGGGVTIVLLFNFNNPNTKFGAIIFIIFTALVAWGVASSLRKPPNNSDESD